MDSLLNDFDSYSETSSSDYQDDLESLYGGQARSIFSSLEETIEKIDDYLLFEPRYLHGDIVCMASDPSGQIGKVIDMDMIVDLESICGSKIHSISSEKLQKIRHISVNDFVVHGMWLGKVEKIVDNVIVLFDDGRKSQFFANGPEMIISLSPDLVEDPQYPFYPGQRVQVESSLSKSTNWLCGDRRGKRDLGTICKVDAGLVYVDWLDCVGINGEKCPAPHRLQNSKDLSFFPCFPYGNWKLGDWCVLPNEQSLPSLNTSQLVEGSQKSETPSETKTAVIVKTKTMVDVQWQDGSQALGRDSCTLRPVNILDLHDFLPDSFVLEKRTVDLQPPENKKFGIVRCVDCKERMVKVKWCMSSVNENFDDKMQVEEIVSAYELVEHPGYAYSPGEAVFRKGRFVDVFTDCSSLANSDLENGSDQTEYLRNNFLSRIGIIIALRNGEIEVKWATGTISKVAPYDIYQVDKCEGMTSTLMHSGENVLQPNEVIQVKDDQLLSQKIKDVLGFDHDNAKDSGSISFSEAALSVCTSITSSLFQSLSTALVGAYRGTSMDAINHGKPKGEDALELCNMDVGGRLLMVDDSKTHQTITSEESKESSDDTTLPSCSKHPILFKQFDIVSGCLEHHFVNASGTGLQCSQMKRGWLKKVHQEWNILEKNLPETVYVRVYEDRIDLLRAAVVGTAGTPYHDGLFFFDVHLPPQYPNEPPLVRYNSGGLRINPNLYESGKVCLSLLNTWKGSDTEIWNPGSSTILQVLLSLQALVLNEKPYFNETGYDSQIGKAEGEKNSLNYNENAFLVSCTSMLYILRKPPKHFEGFVEEHFSRHGNSILLACKAYMEGAPVGYPFRIRETEQENRKGSSTGFKIMLSKIYPRLVEAFSGNVCA
ncbi:probable ubiquitin-conjugating enzyme E2 24 isoform X1 [Primulina eburnea]|uniref:probable ubiquitin-conjugating enzyme E2 24 isoform X1 n=1 Tax=Primulina eburnea TaxID=1245227 RepID=UPI003C6C9C2D